MKKFIKTFKNVNEDKMNMKLINRDYDDGIIDSILEVFRSFETIPSIKFLTYSVEYDESKINFSKYITSRKNTKKREKNIKYHYIKSDRVCELTMKFRVSAHDQVKVIKRSILVPTFDKQKYITLKGNKYFLLYQLVDSSTYVSKMGLTMKSLMPIIIKFRDNPTTITDIDGNSHTFITYYMKVFKRDISVLLFFFCRMGLFTTLKYFILDQIIDIVPNEEENLTDRDENYYFAVNKNMVLKVKRHFFDKYPYVKAMTGMVKECLTSKVTIDQLDSRAYWLEQLGSLYTNTKHKKLDSGRSTMLLTEAA